MASEHRMGSLMVSVQILTRPAPGVGTQRIFDEFKKRGASPEWYFAGLSTPSPSDIILSRIRGDEPGVQIMLDGFSALVEEAGPETRVINPPHAVRVAASKQHQMGVYRAGRIPAPRTVRITAATDLAQVVALLNLPLIVKKDVALEGQGVFLVGSLPDLENLVKICPNDTLLAQTYIPEGAQTLSMVVVGSQVVAAGRSQAGWGKWKTNAAEGATWTGHYPSFREADLAVHVCDHIGLDVGEVEVVATAHGMLVLKVDPSPHLTIVENVTGVNVAALIADFCIEGELL